MKNYDNIIKKQTKNKFKGLKCVKCGSRNDLTTHLLFNTFKSEIVARTQQTTTYENTRATIELPICSKCKVEFEKNVLYKRKNKWSCILSIYCVIMMGILALISFNRSYDDLWYFLGILAVPTCTFIIHYIYFEKKFKKIREDSKNYMKFIGKDVYVKPEGSLNWILYKDWINATLKENVNDWFDKEQVSL